MMHHSGSNLPAFLLIAILLASCSEADLEGYISLEKKRILTGDTVQMELNVPEEFDNMYGVMWTVKPDGVGLVKYKDLGPAGKESKTDAAEVRKEDRKAVFIAQKPGACTIFVHAFYQKSTYQPVTELRIFIEDPSEEEQEAEQGYTPTAADKARVSF